MRVNATALLASSSADAPSPVDLRPTNARGGVVWCLLIGAALLPADLPFEAFVAISWNVDECAGGYKLPKGQDVMISIYNLHHSPAGGVCNPTMSDG